MTFIEKWAAGSFIAALPLLWALAVAQQEANLLGEMPPLAAWATAFVLIGLAVACVWHAADQDV